MQFIQQFQSFDPHTIEVLLVGNPDDQAGQFNGIVDDQGNVGLEVLIERRAHFNRADAQGKDAQRRRQPSQKNESEQYPGQHDLGSPFRRRRIMAPTGLAWMLPLAAPAASPLRSGGGASSPSVHLKASP